MKKVYWGISIPDNHCVLIICNFWFRCFMRKLQTIFDNLPIPTKLESALLRGVHADYKFFDLIAVSKICTVTLINPSH